MKSRALCVTLIGALGLPLAGQETTPGLTGTIEGDTYVSPTNAFRVPVLVSAELGPRIVDNDRMVAFQDSFATYITIGAFKQDATQRWEMDTRGIKDYLIYYFRTFALPDFKRSLPDTQVQSASFAPDFMDGALFCYVLLPGGSMFSEQIAFGDSAKPVAKRGAVLFVRNGYVFVVSSELAERVTEGSHYSKTPAEEDQILHKRLIEIVGKIKITAPAPAKPAASP